MIHRIFAIVLVMVLSLPLSGYAGLPSGAVLFSGQIKEKWDLYMWVPDSDKGNIVALTNTPEAEGNPVFWERKGWVVFSRSGSNQAYSIVAQNFKGDIVASFSDERGNLGWPQPSPWDDRILAVLEDQDTGVTHPGIISLQNGVFEAFPETGLPGGQMAWLSPEKILVTRVNGGEFMLVIRNLTDGAETIIADGARNWLPASNPSGGLPAFFTRRIGQISSIFQLSGDITDPGNVKYSDFSNSALYDWQPSVAPEGKGLIYLSLRDGRFRIIYRDLTDKSETILPITGFDQIFHPTWIRGFNSGLTGSSSRTGN